MRDQTYAILNATATVMAVMQSVELEILVVSSLLNRSGRIIDGVTLLLPQLSAIANVVETQATDTFKHASDIARSVSEHDLIAQAERLIRHASNKISQAEAHTCRIADAIVMLCTVMATLLCILTWVCLCVCYCTRRRDRCEVRAA